MSNISKVLEKLTAAVNEKSPGVSKDDVLKVIDDKFNDTLKKLDTYRKVDDAPKKVNITDISDAAKKKLQNIFEKKDSPDTEGNITPDQLKDIIENGTFGSKDAEGLLGKIGGKLVEWSKEIFGQVFKLVGAVIRWSTSTFMGIITGVSSWLLKKIQVAMGIGAVKGMAGGLRATGRPSLLRMVAAGGSLAAGAYTGYKVMEGLNDLETFAGAQTDQINKVFAEDSSISTAFDAMNDRVDVSTTDSGGLDFKTRSETSDQETSTTPTAPPSQGGSPADEPPPPAASDTSVPSSFPSIEQDQPTAPAPEAPVEEKTPDFVTLPGMTKEQTEQFYLNIAESTTDDLEKRFKEFANQQNIKLEGKENTEHLFESLKIADAAAAAPQQPAPPVPPPPQDTIPSDFKFIADNSIKIPTKPSDASVTKEIKTLKFDHSPEDVKKEKTPPPTTTPIQPPTSSLETDPQPSVNISVDVTKGADTVVPVLLPPEPITKSDISPRSDSRTPSSPSSNEKPVDESLEIQGEQRAIAQLDSALETSIITTKEVSEFEASVKSMVEIQNQPSIPEKKTNLPPGINSIQAFRDQLRKNTIRTTR